MTISRILHTTVIGLVLSALCAEVEARDFAGHCIVRPSQQMDATKLPVSIDGLEPLVSSPRQGFIKLHNGNPDSQSMWRSPANSAVTIVGPYDPKSRRLYVWGYDDNGWIKVNESAGIWYFEEHDIIRPRLYERRNDGDGVALIKRSEALGVQFYSGYAKPHWLTGFQSFHVYKITGEDTTRIKEFEAGKQFYLGDDPATGLAAFRPSGLRPDKTPHKIVWYDGVEIVESAATDLMPQKMCP